MTFNSVEFLLFFCCFGAAYWLVASRGRNLCLLAGSYVFYGWWDWRFLSLLAISTVVDFFVARGISGSEDKTKRLRLLRLSLAVNLGILGVFKYFNFFADSLVSALDTVGMSLSEPTLQVLLPVGISFYTFQTMSYTIDVYRERVEPATSIIAFGTYVAYFPQLVAGPIERAQRLLPLIEDQKSRRFPRGERLTQALSLIVVGLFKKVVIADGVADIVNTAFDDPGGSSTLALWTAAIGFSLQIYGDFAGYTDMARGVSALLGIELVVNFREPYLSRNITEFWRRWHISLSDWLRDYLYISLGGNRQGLAKTLRNLMLTMLIGGLWHGSSWNFVVWGGLHGLCLVIHRQLRGGRVADGPVRWSDIPAVLVTFVVVTLIYVFFRAESFAQSSSLIAGLFVPRSGLLSWWDSGTVFVLAVVTLLIDLSQRRNDVAPVPKLLTAGSSFRSGLTLGLMLAGLVVFSGGSPAPFIYFQF